MFPRVQTWTTVENLNEVRRSCGINKPEKKEKIRNRKIKIKIVGGISNE